MTATSRVVLDKDALRAAVARINDVQQRAGTHLVQLEADGSPSDFGSGEVDIEYLVIDVLSAYLKHLQERDT